MREVEKVAPVVMAAMAKRVVRRINVRVPRAVMAAMAATVVMAVTEVISVFITVFCRVVILRVVWLSELRLSITLVPAVNLVSVARAVKAPVGIM